MPNPTAKRSVTTEIAVQRAIRSVGGTTRPVCGRGHRARSRRAITGVGHSNRMGKVRQVLAAGAGTGCSEATAGRGLTLNRCLLRSHAST